jgi:hypothetical protein
MSETYPPGLNEPYQQFQDLAAEQVAEATAASDRRQEQAAAFQNARTPTTDVTAGQERL